MLEGRQQLKATFKTQASRSPALVPQAAWDPIGILGLMLLCMVPVLLLIAHRKEKLYRKENRYMYNPEGT